MPFRDVPERGNAPGRGLMVAGAKKVRPQARALGSPASKPRGGAGRRGNPGPRSKAAVQLLTLKALQLVADGLNASQIAAKLGVALRTAEDYVRRSKEHLQAQTDALAGLVTETPELARSRTIARFETLAATLTDERARVQLEIKLAEIRGVVGPMAPTVALQINTGGASAGYLPLPQLPGLSRETRERALLELEAAAAAPPDDETKA
jgi:DNA-binding CsgD family transcriptional regulator